MGCFQDDGMHLSDDQVIVEPVDANGDAVSPETRSSKVYVTNLINPLLPLIRYEIGDEVTVIDAPCACGSAYRRVTDIQGRDDDIFVYADGVAVHPIVFRSLLGREPAIVEYQVRQTSDGAEMLLHAHRDVDLRRLERDAEAALRKVGCARPAVTARCVDTLPRLATGKLKRFVRRPA
jgi:phenylacetate-coenzyme A ligase PaaK-like adenylate-forming protein